MIKSLLLSLGAVILIALLAAWIFVPSVQKMPDADLPPIVQATLLPNETAATRTPEEMIHVTSPVSGGKIQSVLVSRGQARGPWYFEGSFPVILTDWDGVIIAQGFAQAEGEWMTEDFVPFRAALKFKKPAGNNNHGYLIYKKNNASGLPEHDAAFEIPVTFK